MMGQRICGTTLIMDGAIVEGREYLERSLEELGEAHSDQIGFVYAQDMLVTAECYYAFALTALGDIEGANQRCTLALERAMGLDHPLTIAYASGHFGLLFAELRDDARLDRCLAHLESTLAEHPIPIWQSQLQYLQGMKALREGHHSTAVTRIGEGLAASERLGFRPWRPIQLGNIARGVLAMGQLDSALEYVGQAFSEIESGQDAWMEPELHRVRGDVLAARGGSNAEIEACYRQALTEAGAQPNRIYELRAALSLARCWRDQGRRDEAREILAPIELTGVKNLPDLVEAQAMVERLS